MAHGLELIGERWALLVVRELLLGPKRFTDLRTGLPGISADVLTQRLRELQEVGVLQRRKLAPPAGSWIYELTEWGAELEPTITRLGRWSSRSPSMRRDAAISVDSLILSLKALFDPHAAQELDLTLDLRLGEDQFRIKIANATIELTRGGTKQPDLTIETAPDTLAALLRNDRQLAEALTAGDLTLTGAEATAERFFNLFPPPEPATIAHHL
ncbi:transcriptional regulator [Nonomuraea mesophila]|uniref:Transcriptional regulator n=1 Tax=Nonomuraea mesophila TaxID=2530382 RepID=A0A4R5FDT4_9ACTN|nr:winged helix-turn-helix transcriptional regulator [Nonomuraea mesophila]TDE47864.1 transcriptional regulator [Nonomuraea mesophila]